MEDERREAFETARAAAPGCELSFESFCAQLDELGWRERLPEHPTSVYLCGACAQGNASAWSIVERDHWAEVRGAVARVVKQPDLIEEAMQLVRNRLLTGQPPKIRSFRGNGPLGRWLRVVATRIAVDEVRSFQRKRKHETDFAAQWDVASRSSAESTLFRRRYGPVIKQVFLEALAALGPEERRLLRLYSAQGLSIDAIGRIYDMHRSTAARKLARVRARLEGEVKAGLEQRLGRLAQDEFRLLVRALSGELDENLSGLLATQSPDDPANACID